MQSEEFSEGEIIDVNQESHCDKKEDVPEEVTTAKNFTIKEFSEIFHDTESAKDKVLEADPNLVEKSKKICHGTEKMLTLLALFF